MKKTISYLLVAISFMACKKPEELNSKNETVVKDISPLVEYSPEKISEKILNKNSDTLYVTNFFATWCGPCIKEIPHFTKKMEELKGKAVKFTFVSIDAKADWPTKVNEFADQYNIRKNVVLLDGMLLEEDFFKKNFKTWSGQEIPFTLIKKGDNSDETIGSMSEENLNEKISKILSK